MVTIAAKEPYYYLSVATPDYATTTLSLKSQKVINEAGTKNQVVHLGEDGSEERINFSSQSIFYFTIHFPHRSESDIGTILDFYFDEDKADGRHNTFKWDHPTDGHTYVVRFDTDLDRAITQGDFYGIPNIRLKATGVIADPP